LQVPPLSDKREISMSFRRLFSNEGIIVDTAAVDEVMGNLQRKEVLYK